MNTVNLSRRGFLKSAGIVGGGLFVGFSLEGCGDSGVLPIAGLDGAFVPNAFLQITPENLVRFYCPRDEMGQGVLTGLATLIAEELDVAPEDIDLAFAGAHPDYNNPDFNLQLTGGSSSLKAHYYPLRQAAANVRAVLVDAAATSLKVPAGSIRTDNAHLLVSGERLPYGQFVAHASTLKLPEQAPLKAKTEFKYIGSEFPRLDAMAKSTGTAVYGIDVDIPGMHHALVKRSPVAGARLVSLDAAKALAMPGVTDVVEISAGVAVVAEKFWQAKKAVELIEVQWSRLPLDELSSAQMRADYEQAMRNEPGDATAERGDMDAATAGNNITIDSEYWAPHLAHAPLEPMNAVVRIADGEADVWSGTQSPSTAQGLVARYAGLDKSRVRVHNTYLGGGFGRRAILTHIVEATETALASGKPIQLLWTREDDIRNGFLRPASLMRIEAGVDADGIISQWRAKRVGGNVMPDSMASTLPGLLPTALPDTLINWSVNAARSAMDGLVVDATSVEGLFEDYDFPNREVRHITLDHGLPLTTWRSVGHSYTAFAVESAIDQLAQASGRDPVQLRLDNTRNNPRLHHIIRIAGERMSGLSPASGHGLGLAVHSSFGSYVAQVAEVSVADGNIRVHRVVCVVDCGQVVNPDIVRAQMEGGIIYGLTAALYGNLEVEKGTIVQSNFHDYPMLRMNESPSVEVVIVDSNEDPTGVGEPGVPPIAPAVANAVFAVTGQRLRELPLRLG